MIDATTLKHLAVIEGADGGRAGSLLEHLDRTQTAMGGRLLRAWLLRPLGHLEPMQDRLDAVEELAFRTTDRGKLRDTLKAVHDLERLVSRAALGTAGPRDLVALRQSLAAVPRVRLLLSEFQAPLVRSVLGQLDDLAELRETLALTLVDEPPALARDGGAIREGVDPELDDLRHISRSGRERIAALEDAERARTGITSLKVRFNRVFGYYIEVSRANLHAVPADYQRKQTIAGGERFITPALKEFEERVLGADERILEREVELFDALRSRVAPRRPAHPGHRARACHLRRAGRACGGGRARATTSSRRCTTATSSFAQRRAAPGRRADVPRAVRAERRHPRRPREPARHPDRARTWAASPPTCARSRCCA